MEGALPSVVGGLTGVPLVAVPTSVGYGASFGGIAALLGMLNSCAPGVTVVNIDNGYGAGVFAARVARTPPRSSRTTHDHPMDRSDGAGRGDRLGRRHCGSQRRHAAGRPGRRRRARRGARGRRRRGRARAGDAAAPEPSCAAGWPRPAATSTSPTASPTGPGSDVAAAARGRPARRPGANPRPGHVRPAAPRPRRRCTGPPPRRSTSTRSAPSTRSPTWSGCVPVSSTSASTGSWSRRSGSAPAGSPGAHGDLPVPPPAVVELAARGAVVRRSRRGARRWSCARRPGRRCWSPTPRRSGRQPSMTVRQGRGRRRWSRPGRAREHAPAAGRLARRRGRRGRAARRADADRDQRRRPGPAAVARRHRRPARRRRAATPGSARS